MSNDELSNDELRQYIANTVGSMAAVPRRSVLVAVDVIIRRHDNALARAEAAEAKVATLLKVVEEYEVMARLLMSELSAQAKRLAELEEAPTGLEWQPVRNAPPEGCVEMRVWPTYDPYDNEYQFGYETVRVANIMRAKGQWRPVAAEEEGD